MSFQLLMEMISMKRALIGSFAALSLLSVPAVAATSTKPATSVSKTEKKAAKAQKKAAKVAAKAAAKSAPKSK